jgi:hypothetical protein
VQNESRTTQGVSTAHLKAFQHGAATCKQKGFQGTARWGCTMQRSRGAGALRTHRAAVRRFTARDDGGVAVASGECGVPAQIQNLRRRACAPCACMLSRLLRLRSDCVRSGARRFAVKKVKKRRKSEEKRSIWWLRGSERVSLPRLLRLGVPTVRARHGRRLGAQAWASRRLAAERGRVRR